MKQERFTPEQITVITNLNNLPVDPNCAHGCGEFCRLATDAASNAFMRTDLTLPQGYDNCKNKKKVIDTLVWLQNSEPKIITTE